MIASHPIYQLYEEKAKREEAERKKREAEIEALRQEKEAALRELKAMHQEHVVHTDSLDQAAAAAAHAFLQASREYSDRLLLLPTNNVPRLLTTSRTSLFSRTGNSMTFSPTRTQSLPMSPLRSPPIMRTTFSGGMPVATAAGMPTAGLYGFDDLAAVGGFAPSTSNNEK